MDLLPGLLWRWRAGQHAQRHDDVATVQHGHHQATPSRGRALRDSVHPSQRCPWHALYRFSRTWLVHLPRQKRVRGQVNGSPKERRSGRIPAKWHFSRRPAARPRRPEDSLVSSNGTGNSPATNIAYDLFVYHCPARSRQQTSRDICGFEGNTATKLDAWCPPAFVSNCRCSR